MLSASEKNGGNGVRSPASKPLGYPASARSFLAWAGSYGGGSKARELDRKKREALLGQIQQIMHDRVLHVPIYELAFLWGIGPRVEEACVDHIKGFSYSAPYEDLKLKPAR